MSTKYDNIPVRKDKQIYAKVQMIAEAKGFGERGAGALIEHWVARELPDCEHPKTAVDVQIFPGEDMLPGTQLHRTGWFCPTCNRVYQRIEKLDQLEAAKEADPYVSAIQNMQQGQRLDISSKRRTQRLKKSRGRTN